MSRQKRFWLLVPYSCHMAKRPHIPRWPFQQPFFKAEILFRNLSSFSTFFACRNRITDGILLRLPHERIFTKTNLILVKNENNQRKINGTWKCSGKSYGFLNFGHN